MAETLTANYGWTKPEVTASSNTWGTTSNSNWDKIDAQVFINAQAGVPIGAGSVWFSATPPANYLICDGSSLSTTTYAALFAVIGYTYGGSGANFSLPNLIQRFPVGAYTALAATGGEVNHVLTAAQMPSHAHSITDGLHAHGVTDPQHIHDASTGAHSHVIATGGHSHGPGNLMKFVGSGGTQGVSASPFNVVQGTTDFVGNLGGNTDTAGNLGVTINYAYTGVQIQANYTGISGTLNAGGGAAHNNMPPYIQVYFIIKFQ